MSATSRFHHVFIDGWILATGSTARSQAVTILVRINGWLDKTPLGADAPYMEVAEA